MLLIGRRKFLATTAVLMVAPALFSPQVAQAQVTAFGQAIAEAAAGDDDLAAFYRGRDFQAIWAGDNDIARARRTALITAFSHAPDHGLPADRYDPAALIARLRAANTPAEQGTMEVVLSRLFLQYARDVQTGILVPSRVDAGIVREVPYRPRLDTINGFAAANPASFIRALPPANPEYTRLMAEKLRLERLIVGGGWGSGVGARSLQPGATGPAVIEMRNRLIAMGVMD